MMNQLLAGIAILLLLYKAVAAADEKSSFYIPPISDVLEKNTDSEQAKFDKKNPAWNSYINTVQDKVSRLPVAYPTDEYGRKIFGRVPLNLLIGRNGELLDVFPIVGHEAAPEPKLVMAALTQVKNAAPFLAPPQELIQSYGSVRLPMVFTFAPVDAAPPLYGPTERFRIQMQGGR